MGPQSAFLHSLSAASTAVGVDVPALAAQAECALAASVQAKVKVVCQKETMQTYLDNEKFLEKAEPHAVYPTSEYRSCDGQVLATEDASLIEGVMSTTISTTIRILSGVLSPENLTLRDVYAPKGRCIAGGVIADLAGFATALYDRNTPYVMLCTSIVSGIDAGPSPRTCANDYGYKNLYGAFHPPVLTLTDRTLWSSLHEGWLRHGIAEIIKMAIVKDWSLFQLLESAGPDLIYTKFGNKCPENKEFGRTCDLIVGKAMHSYVRSEYGNLYETHQCRPHAYGHTWSPGYELPAGMLHGHAVATCMGYGAYLAMTNGFINKEQLDRIMRLISKFELSLWHPIMDSAERVWGCNEKIIAKRGGFLCAPVPRGEIGSCGYIQDLSYEQVESSLKDYKALCQSFPRGGLGVDAHCRDVGLEDPSQVTYHKQEDTISELEAENARLREALARAEEGLAK